jgi:chemotaxis protein CheX
MSECNVEPKPYSVEDFLSSANLDHADASVTEVFGMMFGFDIKRIESADPDADLGELDERSAIVGFSGPMRGSCQVRISSLAARSIASAMLGGAPIEEGDESIDDALGELCNMIAGGWKNGISTFSECTLSPPTVISGRNYKVHFHKPSMKIMRLYQFDVHTLYLTLHCEYQGPSEK